MESVWRKQNAGILQRQETAHTERRECYDVIVVGAGMAGILIAYYLKEQGKEVLVLEAETIASGQTERTTAKITSQHDMKYSKLIRDIGVKKARMYAAANEAAILEYEKLIERKKIACQFARVPAYLYTMGDEEQLLAEAKAAASLGINACFTKDTELPFSVAGAVRFGGQAQFSPLEFIKSLAAELEIREHTRVTSIRGNRVKTDAGVLRADKIVVATHYPILNVSGFYFLRQHQERSYAIAFSGCGRVKGMYYGIDKDGLSFRQAGDLLLLGGSAHRTGEDKHCGAYDFLAEIAKHYFPESKEEARWSAQDCMPHDGIPFIGRYSVFTPNLYVATGFQKWGMTSSMVAAMILRDELCGVHNPYRKVFCPQRINVRAGMKNFLIDVGMSVKGLVRGMFLRPRCSHMGCELVWNPDEKSWDCPCHGSRFAENGKLLDNPAKRDIKVDGDFDEERLQ